MLGAALCRETSADEVSNRIARELRVGILEICGDVYAEGGEEFIKEVGEKIEATSLDFLFEGEGFHATLIEDLEIDARW